MNVLVTGGAGYIGSVVVERLIEMDKAVVVVDDLSQGHRDAVHPEATFERVDLADRGAVERVFRHHKPDAVMHFAARSLVGESMEQPFLYLGENVTNGLNVLKSAVDHGVKRFILSSTANLFDHPRRVPIDEREPIHPGSPYGESKQFLERALYWLDRTHGLRYAALRYFNAAGASKQRGEHHDPETHLIPLVLQVAAGLREYVTIFGDDYPTPDGTCVRDYVHVLDLAEAHILALDALDQGSCSYNLGNGQGFSVSQVVDAARRVTDQPIPTRVGPRRPGDPATLVASSEKIRSELGWEPRHSRLDTLLSSAWRWHQEYPQGYAR